MSDTPRTDAFWGDRGDGHFKNVVVIRAVEFCRQLERELAAALTAKQEAERERDEAQKLAAEWTIKVTQAEARLAAVVADLEDIRKEARMMAYDWDSRSSGIKALGVIERKVDAALARAKEGR